MLFLNKEMADVPVPTSLGHFDQTNQNILRSKSNKNTGAKFRILVVGFTHKSIDNLLKKLVEIIQANASYYNTGEHASTFAIGRIVTEDTSDGQNNEGMIRALLAYF
jgi:hypothetical protein